ncbi:MAG: hypothetical protein REI94_14410 [Moraxellaceae bacterium]|nr:hypothetical protein [Moraxellaceae bacterium]
MSDDSVKTLQAIRNLALADLDATSDETLRAEIEADGGDPEALALSVATELDALVAAAMRARMSLARSRGVATSAVPKRRPVLARMKELIDGAFLADPSLATAFREGTRQSESDLQSLYDDLVDLGRIDPEIDG